MPELPEVETLRRDLREHLVGRRIVAAEVLGRRSVRRPPLGDDFVRRVSGRRLTGVGRHGKYLLLATDAGDALVVHLRMSGQLLLAPAVEGRPKHTHVVLTLDDGTELRFVDPRTFGEVFVSDDGRLPGRLGPDALEALPAPRRFAALVAARRTRLKPLLLDQALVAGIGNIYSDEILHRAGLRHDRAASSLTAAEAERLRRAVRAVLAAAVRDRGSSLADEQYRDLFGRVGGFQHRHRVYGRAGLPCRSCGTAIVRDRVAGRSTYWCPRCQA